MSLVTNARITFPEHNGRRELVMRKITSVHIVTSRTTLTDTAEIEIPRNVKFFENEQKLSRKDITKIFRIGDPVIIELGYGIDANLVEEFRGYISAPISADVPILIRCEDEMYKMKTIAVNYSAASTSIKTMMAAILPGYEVDAEAVELGGVRLSKTTVATVLEKLTDDPWKLQCYFRGKKLFIESAERANVGDASFMMERDVIDNQLNYRNSEEVLVKVKATSVLVNGEKIDFTTGEDGGQVVNLTYYNIELPAEIEKRAKADYQRLKKGGFDGNIVGFGKPSVQHGMRVKLVSTQYPDRDGTCYAEAITKDFVPGDYHQTITLGRKVI